MTLFTNEQLINMSWRTGRKLGRTVYAQVSDDPHDSDVLLGMFDTVKIAEHVVMVHNVWLGQV